MFSVSVPVLSEQIADTDPSVSTDGSRLTIAFCDASTLVPVEYRVVTTAGRPVGIAEMASATPAMKSSSKSWSCASPSRIIATNAMPARPAMIIGQPVELLLQRRLVGLGAVEQVGDAADLGVHPGPGHDQLAATAGDRRVHEHHAQPVAERDVVAIDRRDVLEDRRALARERRFLDLERGGDEQPPVGRDAVARLDQHDVARHEFGRVDLD